MFIYDIVNTQFHHHMHRIIIINFYIGPLPWYFKLFLKSCELNDSIDFLIFSDQNISDVIPSNIETTFLDLEGFNELASEKLDLDINLRSAYKLCDFKPAYGKIFNDYISEYDIWGICDIDTILGNIRNFFNTTLLNNYDVFSVRNDYPTGFFMLFRNNEKINSLFEKSKDYKKVLTSKEHFCFDECNFQHERLSLGEDLANIPFTIESFHNVLVKQEEKNELKVFREFMVIEGIPGKMVWTQGLLIYKQNFEVLLYHLINFKSNKNSKFFRIGNQNKIHIYEHLILGDLKFEPFNQLVSGVYKLILSIKKRKEKINYWLSIHLKCSNLQNDPRVGRYSFGENIISIESNSNSSSYYLKLSGLDTKIRLRPSVFYKKRILMETFPEHYLIYNNSNCLEWIDSSGNSNKYKLHLVK